MEPSYRVGAHRDRDAELVRLAADGGLGFFHADGRPCVTDYEDLSADAASVTAP